MIETKRTMIYAGVAVVLAIVAFFMAPQRITPDAFVDQGEAFFPNFTDPNSAAELEVITFDQQAGAAKPFRVVNNNGLWTIPSHHDYPADGRDRLAQTAAGVIGIKKDDYRTDNIAEHAALGVVDPLDETAGMTGRGQRVTLRDASGSTLADFIIGNQVDRSPNMRYVRVPDQNRVYAARVDLDLSTKFEDWIETDLLKAPKDKIEGIFLRDYSINERTMSVNQRDNLILTRGDDVWKADNMKSSQMVDSTKMDTLLTTLSSLKIVGVRPKPEGLSATLKQTGDVQMSRSDVMSLQQKGFYISREGKLLSNEGELEVTTSDGVVYTLRFGEVVYGEGDEVTAGSADQSSANKNAANRYLFVSASFDQNMFKQPPKVTDRSFEGKPDSLLTETEKANKEKAAAYRQWENKVNNGSRLAADLNRRFADWYYVISSDSYDKIHLTRKQLVVAKS